MGISRHRIIVAPGVEEELHLPTVEELERQFERSPSGHRRETTCADAVLTITRNASDDVQDRTVTLWVDEEPWGRLRYGQTLTRSMQPGHHSLRAHNTLFNTVFEFDVAPGERVDLRCSNSLTRGSILLLWMLHWGALRVRIERA